MALAVATTSAGELPAEDAAPPSQPARKPFVAYSWHGPPGVYDNIIPFFWVTRSTTPERAKAATDAMPEGHRVLFNWNFHSAIHNHPEDRCRDAHGVPTKHGGVWWDHGAKENAKRFDDFFRRYHAIGGKLDTFVVDHEVNLSNWGLGKNEERYRTIMADPRFDALARQLGFRDLMTVPHYQRYRGEKRTHYLIWNAVMHERVAAYFNTAFYDPIRKYYPDVKLSNYDHCDGKPPHTVPDSYGHDYHQFSTGAAMHVGTHQSRSLYCEIRHISDRIMPGGYRPYGEAPFAGFRLGVNRMRSMVLANDVPVSPWISHKRYTVSRMWYTDLYQELIFHVGLCNPDVFLLWNPNVWGRRRGDPVVDAGLQTKLVSDCLKQLDELVGSADRKTRVKQLCGWYDEYVLTGMSAGGRSVWRFTPKLGRGQQREDTLRSASPAVFRIGPTEIRFAEGTIFCPTTELSDQGHWIVAPADARPVVATDWSSFVTDEDRKLAADKLTQFDGDRDGVLTRDEMRNTTLAELQRLWFMGDADQDGRLRTTELAIAHAIRRYDEKVQTRDSDPHRLHGLARHIRARYDKNQDMFLERTEWQPAGAALTNIGEADDDGEVAHLELVEWLEGLRSLLPESLRSLDANRDEQVTMAEFASGGNAEKGEFDKHDENADGVVTADEGVTPMVERDGRHTYSNDRPRVVAPESEVYADISIDSKGNIADLDVRLSVSKFNQQLLDVYLIGPNGEHVALYTGKLRPWERFPIFEDTVLDDEAAEITATLPRPPRKRAIRPEGAGRDDQSSLSSFSGKPIAGTWRLLIRTKRSSQSALLHSWSLLVQPE